MLTTILVQCKDDKTVSADNIHLKHEGEGDGENIINVTRQFGERTTQQIALSISENV